MEYVKLLLEWGVNVYLMNEVIFLFVVRVTYLDEVSWQSCLNTAIESACHFSVWFSELFSHSCSI